MKCGANYRRTNFIKIPKAYKSKDEKMKISGKISQIENRCVLLRFYKNWNKSYTHLLKSTAVMNFWFSMLCYIWKGSICLLLFSNFAYYFFLSSVVYPSWRYSVIVIFNLRNKSIVSKLFYATIRNDLRFGYWFFTTAFQFHRSNVSYIVHKWINMSSKSVEKNLNYGIYFMCIPQAIIFNKNF